ncbi:MAG TPA: hypothetical protein DEA96_12600 [Leptospiraceae bacterium]|nr:hypothetical protein [Spirochaetaceae bacterium]HBS05802.1 hypothetical protein [Leptospiraceae bacterium]
MRDLLVILCRFRKVRSVLRFWLPIILLITVLTSACNEPRTIPQSEPFSTGWSYAPVSNPSKLNVDDQSNFAVPEDSEFQTIGDGRPLITLPRGPYVLGWEARTVWFRSPEIPSLDYRDPVLYSPLMNQSIRLFVQGSGGLEEIYRFGKPELGPDGFAGWPNHIISLSPELEGKRIYALVFSETLSVAVSSPANALAVGERGYFVRSIIQKDLARICLGFLFSFAAIFALILYIRNRSEKLLGAFGFFALPCGIYVISNRTVELQHLLLDAPVLWMYLEHISLGLAPLTFGAFMWQALPSSRTVRWITLTLGAYLVLAAILNLFGVPLYELLYPFFYITLLSCLGISAVIIVQAFHKNREARIILVGLTTLMICAIYDMLGALGLIFWPFQIITWGFLAFQVSLGSILYLRYTDTHRQLQQYSHGLEEKVQERTASLDRTLREVRMLKEKQDGDYFLISLLMHPLRPQDLESGSVTVAMELQQKKRFEYRGRKASIGGDVCLAREVELQGKLYIAFINGDAMGKSMQGAGGAVVLGTTFGSAVERTKLSSAEANRRPETWLRDSFREMNRVFLSFEGSMMTTMLLGLIEEKTGKLYYINCEHPYVALYSKGEASFPEQKLTTKLGLARPETEPEVNQLELKPGEALCMGSDGKDDLIFTDADGTEKRNADEGLFLRLVAECQGNPEVIRKSITDLGEVTDDLSLLTVYYQ